MMLRWLVHNWLRNAAQQSLKEAIGAAANEEPQADDGEEPAAPPPCEIAVLFALGIEAGGLVDLLEGQVTTRFQSHVEHTGLLHGRRIVLAETGVGQEAAAETTRTVFAMHHPSWIISAGFAGSLSQEARRGHILMASEVADVNQQRLEIQLNIDRESAAGTRGLHIGRLLTVDRLIRTRSEREQLGAEHAALACDMETFAIVSECRQLNTHCMSVRVISDGLEDDLPREIETLLDQTTLAGKLGAAAGAIFQRPSSVKDMWQLKEDALKASDRLARFLTSVVAQIPA